ncbi:MAG: hypothetical protein Q7S80_02140, partial [bacterium]|nr:hypothetical protein [bacterium]
MKSFFQKFIISIIGLSIALNPLIVLVPQNVKAADQSDSEGASVEYDSPPPIQIDLGTQKNVSYQISAPSPGSSCPATAPAYSDAYNNLLTLLTQYSGNGGSNLTFSDIFTDPSNPRIVMNTADRNAVKTLMCLSRIMPNYAEDYTALYLALPKNEQGAVDRKNPPEHNTGAIDSTVVRESASSTPRFTTWVQYFNFLKSGVANQDPAERVANYNLIASYIKEAQKSYTNTELQKKWAEVVAKINRGEDPGVDASTLVCITGLSVSRIQAALITGSSININAQERSFITGLITTALDSLVIDIRIVNTLIYLVTPKDQGGAGHWRIRVARLLQSDAESRESDTTIQTNNNVATPTLTAASANNAPAAIQCDSTMTAAECGSQQNQGSGTAVVEDTDGTQYDAFFQDMDKELNDDRNISAHNSGQAIDISEVDDLRCTLVKKRRLGGDTKQKQPIRPIKLVWQTTDGYTKSGGNPIDQMGMMKDLAKQSIIDLLSSMNGDITQYDGDLTKANFTDLVGILGQSLLAGVVSSPGHNLKGYNATDTIKALGAMYFADYFGLPKEIFKDADITDLENLKYIIGRSAVEKNLGLPFGSLDNLDLLATHQNGQTKPVYDLLGLLVNVGQRKIEHEMGLRAHDLDRFFQLKSDGTSQYLIDNKSLGRVVIEADLNLPKNSWPTETVDFNHLKNYISDARVAILRIDPGYIDTILHIDPGTTKSFMSGPMKSEEYAEKVGLSRYNNTTAGLKYFQLNNSAYQLPGPTQNNPDAFDTWAEALRGNPEALKTIGIYTLARLLGQNSLDMDPSLLPTGATFQSATLSSSDGQEIGVPFDRATYGQFVFRDWLRLNLATRITAADGCTKPRPDNSAINIVYSGQTVYRGPADLQNPTQADATNSVASVCQLYQGITVNEYNFTDTNGNRQKLTGQTAYEIVSETSARSAGLESSDLYSIMGYRQANGRSVFERIGAKMLYYGIANKALSPEEKATIDLKNTNPSLVINGGSDKTIVFYLSRIVKIQSLVSKIKNDWAAVSSNDPEIKDITDRINKIVADVKSIYADADFDLTKIYKIATLVATIKPQLSDLKNNLEILRDRYGGISSTEAVNKINQINALIYDVNTLILTASEIMAGHTINSTDALSIDTINQAAAKNKNSSSSRKGLSDWEIMLLVFGLLSHKITPEEFTLRLGANTAEGKLGLPRNSLLYLVQNYEKYGLTGIDTFYAALGQAQIEEEFSMPTYYFQGNVIKSKMPRFALKDKDGKYTDLVKWAGDLILPARANALLRMRVTNSGSVSTSALAPKQPTLDEWIDGIRMMHGKGSSNDFNNWVRTAQKNWLADPANRTQYLDKNADDIVANISTRGFAGGIQSAQNDLLMRLGFPTGIYDGLVQNQPIAWGLANSRARAIDKVLKLPDGYTKMLFTGDKSITSKSISQKDKNLLQASSLNISNNELEKYIAMLNGALLPSEAGQYGIPTDYVVNNPYADPQITGTACPITYTAKDGFMVNETTVPSDSFCYYDKKGRHCFQSSDEATRFANDHDGDKITDVLGDIAGKIASQLNLNFDEVYSGMRNFVNNNKSATIFTDNALRAIIQQQGGSPIEGFDDAIRIDITKAAFEGYNKGLAPTLMNLFTRTAIDAPLSQYKIKVGTWVAQAVLTANIFDSLGLNIDPTLFDGGDFYDILTGDYSSLYRLGGTFVDRALDLKPGTTMLIVTAVSPQGRKCALASAGGGLLGSAFGLNYFPLNRLDLNFDDFMSTLGQEKIEETLSLPRGTFRVVRKDPTHDDLPNLVKNVGVINFFVAFKLPLDLTGKTVAPTGDQTDKQYFEEAIGQILGELRYNSVKNTSPQYKLAQVKTFLSSSLVVTGTSDAGRENLERLLERLLENDSRDNGIYAKLASTDPNVTLIKPMPAGGNADDSNTIADYNQQVKNFYNHINYLDNTFGLARFSTGLLLSQRTKPSAYINSVGDALGIRVGELQLAQLLGLDQAESAAAVDLANNIKSVFACKGNDQQIVRGRCVNGSGLSAQPGEWYHRWDKLYSNLDKVFHFKLDARVGFDVGTIGTILDNPGNTFPILLGIGAKKLDAETGLNSTTAYSFSGLYKAILPAESGVYQTTCHAQIFPNGEDVVLDNQIASAVNDLRRATTEEDKAAKAAALQALRDTAAKKATDLRDCIGLQKAATPDYQARVWEALQNGAANFLHDTILDFKIPGCREGYYFNQYRSCNIGIDMPVADIRAMMGGDLRYMQAAGLAMGANLAFIEIGNIGTRNCNPAENPGGCDQAVPVGMRISYDEIKLALFGLPRDQLIPLMAWNEESLLTDTSYQPEPDSGSSFANIHGGDGSLSSILASVGNSSGTLNDATKTVQAEVAYRYGYNPKNLATEIIAANKPITELHDRAVRSCVGSTDPNCVYAYEYLSNNMGDLQHRLNLLTNPQKERVDKAAADEIQNSVKKAALDKMKFDLMDIALWKIDENIFPGFSQIMVNGNTSERWAALAQYTKNGLVNGHLFGINFSAIDANLVSAGAASIAILTATTQPQKQAAYVNLGTSGLNTLTNWISNHSERYLGFKLNADITGGLLVSIFTGNMGAKAFSLDGVLEMNGTGTTPFIGGQQFVTLGGAVMNFGLGKIFAWADKALGLKPD